MAMGFKGGLAAFVKGAQQGVDRAREMENQDRNAAWLESQRKETTDKQAREEATRQKMTQVGKDRFEPAPQAGPGLQMPDGSEAPMAPIQVARKARQDETLRDFAEVQRSAGNIESALNATQAADTYVDTQRKKFDTDLADAVAKGDADRITQVVNGVGKNRVTGAVAITPFERDLPGYGKVPTFNATFKVQDPFGKVVEQTINSHDLQTRLQPFATQMEVQHKGRKDEREERESVSKIELHGAHTRYYTSASGKNDALTANGGKASSARADHFDEKQWDTAAKIDKAVVSLPNDMSGKDVESPDLRAAYLKTFNTARAGGTMAPNEAVEHATTTVAKLRAAAERRVEQARAADKSSNMTLEKAVRDILKESARFAPKPAPAAAPARRASGPTSPAEAGMRRSAQLTPAQQAKEDRLESDPEMLIALDREIAQTRAPESLRVLREYRAGLVQRIGALPQ
ncbi:hypothetical protein [Polaromonas sp. CG9_12]|nr:hypothetical protein [Polaromonas sp. CG9_12]